MNKTLDNDFLPQLDSDAERKLTLRYWEMLTDSLASGVPSKPNEIHSAADRAGVAPSRGVLIWNNMCRWIASEPLIWS